MFIIFLICLIIQSSIAYEQYSASVCEYETLEISCPEETHIKVISANYGRLAPGSVICPHKNIYTTNCRSSVSLSVVENRCNKKQNCYIDASNSLFGDPCRGTLKYLEVKHSCIPNFMSRIACEGSDLEIACPSGEQMKVVAANYGRTLPGNIVCARPPVDQYTVCSSATALKIVSERCKGKPHCVIPANNNVFGDPCVNVYKYLEVKYGCFGHSMTVHACEGGILNLDCPVGWHIKISSANYGRTRSGSEICPHRRIDSFTNCISAGSLQLVGDRCNSKQNCAIHASNNVFGDPCRGTYKYLTVQYSCLPN